MKLLFDENLSPRLVRLLSDFYPGSVHVRDVGLSRSSDVKRGQSPFSGFVSEGLAALKKELRDLKAK